MASISVSEECTDWWKTCSCHKCPLRNLLFTADILTMEPVPITCSSSSGKKLPTSFGSAISPISRLAVNGFICALWWTSFPERSFPGISLPNLMQSWSCVPLKRLTKNGMPLTGLCSTLTGGTQYTAFSFRQLLDSLNVVQSFSKKGYPFDNACCECFFKYLKKEEINRRAYYSLQELQLSVFEYIEGYYNSRRPHGTLGMLTPNEAETLYWEQV